MSSIESGSREQYANWTPEGSAEQKIEAGHSNWFASKLREIAPSLTTILIANAAAYLQARYGHSPEDVKALLAIGNTVGPALLAMESGLLSRIREGLRGGKQEQPMAEETEPSVDEAA